MGDAPSFPFALPRGYRWLVDRGLVGFAPFTALQPWYFVPSRETFSVTTQWPKAENRAGWYVFARRQDTDDLACFTVEEGGLSIVVIHGWTPEGYAILARYPSIWGWLKHAVDDVAAVVDARPNEDSGR